MREAATAAHQPDERGYLNLRLNYEGVAEFTYRPGNCTRDYHIVVDTHCGQASESGSSTTRSRSFGPSTGPPAGPSFCRWGQLVSYA